MTRDQKSAENPVPETSTRAFKQLLQVAFPSRLVRYDKFKGSRVIVFAAKTRHTNPPVVVVVHTLHEHRIRLVQPLPQHETRIAWTTNYSCDIDGL